MLEPFGQAQEVVVSAAIQKMHSLVTYGPSDLEVASAMSAQGYDEVKWADGQGMFAELIASEVSQPGILLAALAWYEEASRAARRALEAQPRLLHKLGLTS